MNKLNFAWTYCPEPRPALAERVGHVLGTACRYVRLGFELVIIGSGTIAVCFALSVLAAFIAAVV